MTEFDTKKDYVRRERPSVQERKALRKKQAEDGVEAAREYALNEHARLTNMERLRALKKPS